MKRAKVDHEFYERLLEAFRNDPGNISRASASTGIDRRTARKGWNEGWPKQGLGAICEVVTGEQAEIRSRLALVRAAEAAETADREARETALLAKRRESGAREDSLVSRTEEAKTVRAARHNAMGLLATVQRLIGGAHSLAERIEKDLRVADMKPAQAISLFQSIASTARQANETARLAISMERTLLGEPDKIVGHVNMTNEDAVQEIRLAQRAADRAEARSLANAITVEAEPA